VLRCIDRGEVRVPVRATVPGGEGELESCCVCGLPTRSGIYVRGKAAEFAKCERRES